MMRQEVQKKNLRLAGGGTRKVYQEVNVIRHYNPNNTNRKKGGHMPEIKCYNDFPPTSRYMHLHPVFKLVDNFMNTNGMIGRTAYSYKQRSDGKCFPECISPTPRMYSTKTSSIPVTCGYFPQKCANFVDNVDRIRSNMNNINNQTNVRMSLKDVRCTSHSQCDIAVMEKMRRQESQQSSPRVSNDYIQQLKSEIRNSKIECSNNCSNSSYVHKLKDEIEMNKAKYVEEARNLINELKNEITNYRLGPRKYSASCCNLNDTLRKTSPKECCQKSKELVSSHHQPQPLDRQMCCKKPETPRPLREKSDLERYKPFETLWQSKGSLASSSDMDSVPMSSHGFNFEEKLDEANSLIERVRKALKDIGKDIHQKPQEAGKSPEQQRRVSFDSEEPVKECANDSNCITKTCSDQGDCCNQKKDKQESAENKVESNKTKDKKIKISQLQPKSKENIEEEKGEQRSQEIVKIDPNRTSISDIDSDITSLERDELIMEILQKKLNVITELSSESEGSVNRRRRSSCASSGPEKVERGCSPIRKNLTTQRFSDDIEPGKIAKCTPAPNSQASYKADKFADCRRRRQQREDRDSSSTVSRSSSCRSTQLNQFSPRSSKNSSGMVNTSKPKKLTLQVMPPVSIRSGLVIQRTLNLNIKPSGKISNENLSNENIGYEEVQEGSDQATANESGMTVACPEDCKDLEYHCKYKVLENIIDTQRVKSGPSTPGKQARISMDFINALNEDALLLFKSYQIVDSKADDSSSTASLANRTHHIVKRNISADKDQNQAKSKEKMKPKEKVVEEPSPSRYHGKNPWEMGLYKSISTQVSDTSLIAALPPEAPKLPSANDAETDNVPVNETTRGGSLPLSPNEADQERLNKILTLLQEEEEAQMNGSGMTEAPSIKLRIEEKVEPEEPQLVEEEFQRRTTLSTEGSPSRRSSGGRKSPTTGKSSSTSSSSSSSTSNKEDDGIEKKEEPSKKNSSSSSSTSSSSASSYNVYGSKQSDDVPYSFKGQSVDSTSGRDSSVKPTEMSESKPRELDLEEQKIDQLQTYDGTKADEGLQVSLPYSSTDESSKSTIMSTTPSNSRERMNTITCFIKGLTGTSQEELQKMKSTPSILPQSDLKEWSRTFLRNSQEMEIMSKRSEEEVIREEIMDSTDFDKAEEELPKMEVENGAKGKKGGKKPNSTKVVMRVSEIRRPFESGEGMLPAFNKRKLPFYRRVLGGRKVDTSKPVISEQITLDESVSEGEINCKCSVSTGEVHPCKVKHEKAYAPRHFRKLEYRRDIGDKTLRVARQRTQYNNWVNYYLQKHKSGPIDDSSYSTSSRRHSFK